MLKVVFPSSNRKTGEIAVTYRAGALQQFGTCPKTCALNPLQKSGSDVIDWNYFKALKSAVPKDGLAWTYTHFPTKMWQPTVGDETTINYSADTLKEAVASQKAGYPTTVVVEHDQTSKVETHDGVRFVRCPAEYSEKIDCKSCGRGQPLCARKRRDYVIKFTRHGTGAKKRYDAGGGCYSSFGPSAIQWKKVVLLTDITSDGQKLLDWVSGLPAKTMLRHHVAGDIGQ